MQPGSPFYHFPSKQALLEAVMQEGMERALASQAQALAEHTAPVTQAALAQGDAARACLGVLVRHHFTVLFGAESDFIPVMLYEWRSLDNAQRARVVELKRRYEAAWMPVLEALSVRGELRAPVPLARLLLFGALNWSVQWFDASRGMSLDEVTAAALQLFLSEVGA
jgi:AcrR family transcriptional regulator